MRAATVLGETVLALPGRWATVRIPLTSIGRRRASAPRPHEVCVARCAEVLDHDTGVISPDGGWSGCWPTKHACPPRAGAGGARPEDTQRERATGPTTCPTVRLITNMDDRGWMGRSRCDGLPGLARGQTGEFHGSGRCIARMRGEAEGAGRGAWPVASAAA